MRIRKTARVSYPKTRKLSEDSQETLTVFLVLDAVVFTLTLFYSMPLKFRFSKDEWGQYSDW